jgi:hypothetical protein
MQLIMKIPKVKMEIALIRGALIGKGVYGRSRRSASVSRAFLHVRDKLLFTSTKRLVSRTDRVADK